MKNVCGAGLSGISQLSAWRRHRIGDSENVSGAGWWVEYFAFFLGGRVGGNGGRDGGFHHCRTWAEGGGSVLFVLSVGCARCTLFASPLTGRLFSRCAGLQAGGAAALQEGGLICSRHPIDNGRSCVASQKLQVCCQAPQARLSVLRLNGPFSRVLAADCSGYRGLRGSWRHSNLVRGYPRQREQVVELVWTNPGPLPCLMVLASSHITPFTEIPRREMSFSLVSV